MSRETILITGASGAIGSGIARRLATPERCIVLNYRTNAAAANRLVEELRPSTASVFAIQANVSDPSAVDRMFVQILEQAGGIDALVHAAAPPLVQKSIQKVAWDDFQRHLDVQVKGALLCSQAALEHMRAKKRGRIVAVLSAYVIGPAGSGFASYVTGKHALHGLMQAIGAESARWGVRVNMVSPSLTPTDLVACIPERAFELAAEQHPLGRLCTPEDVGNVVQFLLSPAASYLHLANIPITGGRTG